MIDYKDPKAVLEICEKATPGPWKVSQMDDCFIEPRICLIPANGCYDYEKIPSNADLIALSREALPYWVAEAERLREELNRTERALLLACGELSKLKNGDRYPLAIMALSFYNKSGLEG